MGAAGRPLPLVLMYHSVSPTRFDRQLRWLRRCGLRGVSMRELLDRGRDTANLVGLTFDDGYADFVANVMPALSSYGFTATVFVVAGRLGGTNEWDADGPRKRLLTAAQIRDVAAAGMEVASHGLRHIRLPAANDATLLAETARSREILEMTTKQQVTGFCYPYGDLNGRAVTAVRNSGYSYGCAVADSDFRGDYAIPRTYIGERDTEPRLAAKWLRHRVARRRLDLESPVLG